MYYNIKLQFLCLVTMKQVYLHGSYKCMNKNSRTIKLNPRKLVFYKTYKITTLMAIKHYDVSTIGMTSLYLYDGTDA